MKKNRDFQCFPRGNLFLILLKMKLILFFTVSIFITASAADGYSQAKKFNLNLNNVTIEEVFDYIEKNSEFIFLYNEKWVDVNRQIDLNVNDGTVVNVLEQVFADTRNYYNIYDRQIVILELPAPEASPEAPKQNVKLYSEQQPERRDVSGRVLDRDGLGIPGVSIIVKGTTIGVVSDFDGNFQLKVPVGARELVFSFVGMRTQEVDITGRTTVSVTMEEESIGLQDVVVVGYGIQKKESVVGSITTAQAEALEKRGGTVNLGNALSGQLPGVTVMSRTGEPGREDPLILIRGQSTWNSASPLILVDGIERRMNDINVTEVESVSVLKDASATSVFGVKGANGVILITTKRGAKGKPKLSVSASNTFKTVSKISTMAEAFTAKNWKNAGIAHEVSVNEASWAYYMPEEHVLNYKFPQKYPELYPNIYWPDVMLKDYTTDQQVTLNVNGGNELTRYFASVGYTHEGDIFKSGYNEVKGYNTSYSYDRINFRGNLDFDLTSSTLFSVNLSGYTGMKTGANIFYPGWVYSSVYNLAPDIYVPRYSDGMYGYLPGNTNPPNVLAVLNEAGVIKENRGFIGSDFKLEQKLDVITKGLSVNGRISFDNYFGSVGPNIIDGGNQGQAMFKYVDPAILNAVTRADSLAAISYFYPNGALPVNDYDWILRPWRINPESPTSGALRRSIFYQLSMNYNRSFGVHDVGGLFLFSRRKDATGANFPSFQEDWVGRVTYAYNEKYLLEVNGAYNGSEKFGPGYRFGFFPSLAAGWMISNEQFLSHLDWLTKLKVRGSIGMVGSDAGIPRWGYLDSWITGDNRVLRFGTVGQAYFGANDGFFSGTWTPQSLYSIYPAFREGTIANPDINWETALKKNIGIELSLFENMLAVEADYFHDRRDNIFMTSNRRNIPDYFGAPPVPANIGKTKTTGIEVDATHRYKLTNNLGYWVRFSATRARDVVLKAEDPEGYPAYQKTQGFAIGQTKTQIRSDIATNWDDVYAQTSLENNQYKLPGDWDIIDFDGDGLITTYDNIPYGFPNNRPQNTYSSFLGIDFKNFSFMVQFYGVTNITQVIKPGNDTPKLEPQSNLSELSVDYWTPLNPNAAFRAPRVGTSSPIGEFYHFDGSYLRLKTAEIAYSMPKALLSHIGLSSMRVYVNGNDLLFWSDLPFDNERGSLDMTAAYPKLKHINVGVDISF